MSKHEGHNVSNLQATLFLKTMNNKTTLSAEAEPLQFVNRKKGVLEVAE